MTRRWIVGLLALPLLVQAGGVVDLRTSACQGTPDKPKVAAFVPAVIGNTTVSVPVCMTIGASLTVNMAAVDGPTLEAAAAAPQIPKMTMERVAVPSDTTLTVLSYTLLKTPAPNTLVLSFLRSAGLGQNTIDTALPTVAAPKTVSIQLPDYRGAGDTITLVYWTLE